MAKGDYMYGVVELVDGELNRDVSHYVFKTITEANAWRDKMQANETDARRGSKYDYFVIMMYKR